MQSATVFLLALVAVVVAEGQFYVPRAYYTIDDQGHASPPVPLRRLRRAVGPYPYPNGGSANANAEANSYGGGDATANAIANAGAGGRAPGGWGLPSFGSYGASNPNLLSPGLTRRQAGPLLGHSVTASSSVGVGPSGLGYYDQYTSVNN